MPSYGVQVAFGVFVDARLPLYLTMAWTKGLAAAHEACTRLAAEATVRRLRTASRLRLSAAERLPPETWNLIRSQLVLQAVEDVERDLLRRAVLCPRCQADPARTSGDTTLGDFLTCLDCMEWNYDTDLDLRWGRDRYEQVRVPPAPCASPSRYSRDGAYRMTSLCSRTTTTGNANFARQVRTRGDCAAAPLSEQRRQLRHKRDLPDRSLARAGAHSRHDLCQCLGQHLRS